MSDASTYALSKPQRESWRSQLAALKTVSNTTIAKKLNATPGLKKSSWTNVLSEFRNGREAGLRRIFDKPDALKVVATALGSTPANLRRFLELASQARPEDDPSMHRVPGFEDLGTVPILEALIPPWVSACRSIGVDGPPAGRLELTKCIRMLDRAEPESAVALLVTGPPGLGRSAVLQALTACLEQDEAELRPFPEVATEPDHIVIQDDIDRMPPADRTRLLDAVCDAHAVLIASMPEGYQLERIPRQCAVMQLGPGHVQWATENLRHLERLWTDRGHPLDLRELRRWLVNDPYPLALASRPDTLGHLARHVMAEGWTGPIRHADLLSSALRHWARVLRGQGRVPEARTLDLCGFDALGRLAVRACEDGDFWLDQRDFARIFAEASQAYTGEIPWKTLGPSGLVAVVERLHEVGAVVRQSQRVRLAQPTLLVTALGHELGRTLDPGLVRAAVLQPKWRDALVVAAEDRKDPCPILAAFEDQPASVRCLAFPAVTRLLSLSPTKNVSDPELLQRVFVRCLRWWTTRPGNHRVGNLPALVALGLASQRHHASLAPVTSADVRAVPLAPSIAAYLDALGKLDPSDDDMRFALMLGAPFQSDYIWDPALWQRLPPDGQQAQSGERSIAPINEDYEFWWHNVAAPRLELDKARGRRWIAGVQEGMSIRSAMTQRRPGAKIWSRHLRESIERGDEGAMEAFAEAVVTTLQWSTWANFYGVVAVWTELSRRHRKNLRLVVLEAIPKPPAGWNATDPWMAWMLRKLVDADGREHLWSCWTQTPPSEHPRIPWRSFLRAGLPGVRMVDWALETLPENVKAKLVQVQIIAHFILSTDIEALCLIIQSLDPFRGGLEARNRLGELDPTRLRRLDLEIAATLDGEERATKLQMLHPAHGEEELWRGLANTAEGLSDRLLRLIQTECVCTSVDATRPRARRALQLFESAFRDECASAEVQAILEQDHAAWHEQGGLDDLTADKGRVAARAFHQIGNSLLHTRVLRPEGIADLVRFVFEGNFRKQLFVEPFHPWWWLLAILEFSPEVVLDWLEPFCGSIDDQQLRALFSNAFLSPLAKSAMARPRLRAYAVAAMTRASSTYSPADLVEALAALPVLGALDHAGELLAHLATIDGTAAVAWLRETQRKMPAQDWASLWERLALTLEDDRARTEALEAWLTARQAHTAD